MVSGENKRDGQSKEAVLQSPARQEPKSRRSTAGNLRSDQVKQIAKQLGASERDVVDIDDQLAGDACLNVPLREGDGEWQDLLADDADDQEHKLVDSEEASKRHDALAASLGVLNPRERRIFEARRLTDDPITLAIFSSELGVSRGARTSDRVARLRKASTRGEGGLRDERGNSNFSGGLNGSGNEWPGRNAGVYPASLPTEVWATTVVSCSRR